VFIICPIINGSQYLKKCAENLFPAVVPLAFRAKIVQSSLSQYDKLSLIILGTYFLWPKLLLQFMYKNLEEKLVPESIFA